VLDSLELLIQAVEVEERVTLIQTDQLQQAAEVAQVLLLFDMRSKEK
jgi:hypothetical protein